MAHTTPAEGSSEDIHNKIARWVETKRYIEEPEILPWYKKHLDELNPRTRELFETYSNIPPADVESHVKNVVSLLYRR